MEEAEVQSLGRKDSLEKGMATHYSILTGESQGQRSLTGSPPWSHKELGTTEQLTLSTLTIATVFPWGKKKKEVFTEYLYLDLH